MVQLAHQLLQHTRVTAQHSQLCGSSVDLLKHVLEGSIVRVFAGLCVCFCLHARVPVVVRVWLFGERTIAPTTRAALALMGSRLRWTLHSFLGSWDVNGAACGV